MSYEVVSGKNELGQFASNNGYNELIKAVGKSPSYPALRALFETGESKVVQTVAAELTVLASTISDPDVVSTAKGLAQLIKGQAQIMITDGVS